MPKITTTLCVYGLPQTQISANSRKLLANLIAGMYDLTGSGNLQANIIFRSIADNSSISGIRCEVLINFLSYDAYAFECDREGGDLLMLTQKMLAQNNYEYREMKFAELDHFLNLDDNCVNAVQLTDSNVILGFMDELPALLSLNQGSAVLIQIKSERYNTGTKYLYPVALSIICQNGFVLNSFMLHLTGCTVTPVNVRNTRTLMLGPSSDMWSYYCNVRQDIVMSLCAFPGPEALGFVRSDIVSEPNESIDKGYVGDSVGLKFGRLRSNHRKVGIPAKQLSKHLSIFGTPGQGKTTLIKSILSQLYHDGVPWLVIECAKNEYRSLAAGAENVNVFTPGRDFVSPWLWDLFSAPCGGITVGEQKQLIKAIFEYLPLETPIDLLVDSAVSAYFANNGLYDFDIVPTEGAGESISRLISAYKQCVSDLKYASNSHYTLTAAGVLRLGHIEPLFAGRCGLPLDILMSQHSIVECQGVDNEEYRTLLIYALLRQIYMYLMANKPKYSDDKLRFVLVIEEAHVILRRNDGRGGGRTANILQDFIVRMLNELRSYGVGIIIVDQSPEAVGREVIKATTSKISFRLTENNDCKIFSEATHAEPHRLQSLRQGQAIYSSLGFNQPLSIITDRNIENVIGKDVTWVSDTEVHDLMFAPDGFYGKYPSLLHRWLRCPKECVCSLKSAALTPQMLSADRKRMIDSVKNLINDGEDAILAIEAVQNVEYKRLIDQAKATIAKYPDCKNLENCFMAYIFNGFLQISC